MALLAEQKRKARFGLDPRNTSWSNDTSKFGQRLMEKMGWEKGKGLGANENGITENIKAAYKSDSSGLGCTPQAADAWIAHQDDFNDLLKALNSQSEAGSQEDKVERTDHVDGRKRYHGRFARGQVQTLRSTEDLDCIFGKRKGQSKTAEPEEQPALQPDCGDGQEEKSHGLTTVTSTSSVQEYFAKKMAEMKARKEANTREDDSGETSQRSKDDNKSEKKKKKQKSSFGTVGFSYDEVREVSGSAGVDGAASKSCRGWYKDFLQNSSANVENTEVKDKSSKKKKQKKTESDIENNEFEEKVKMSDSKKQRKKKKDKVRDDSVAVLESTELPLTVEVAENKQSKKKKKKNKDSEAVPAASVYEGVSAADINEEKDVKTQKDKRKASKNDEGEDKKQSKKKKKENEEVPAASECEDVITVNINDANVDKKKQKKKKRKASDKDEIVVSSLNKSALCADEVDVNETAIEASSLTHSSKGLVTHSNEIHDDNRQEKENADSAEHKKKNKKKRKQSEIIDKESKPVEKKCENDNVAVESKKKKKRKHSEINDEESKPVESVCDKNDDSAVEPKKKKKKRKGNDADAQDTEDPAATEHKSGSSSGNLNIVDVSQSSEQKEKKKRKRKKKTKPLQDQSGKSNAFFPGSNLAEIVGYGHKSAETKKFSKEDSNSSKQKTR